MHSRGSCIASCNFVCRPTRREPQSAPSTSEVNMTHLNSEMHRNDATFSLDATPLELQLPRGAAVFAVRGHVWITQERMPDDIVLTAGERFDVRSREPLLLSAIKESAVVLVVPPAEARITSGRDLYDVM